MRGTRISRHVLLQRPRFIPAYAGNASGRSTTAARTTVHPRVCGERDAASRRCPNSRGSSPRMRGTPHVISRVATFARFIPAYAGNARRRHIAAGRRSVHPRVCGERLAAAPPGMPADGSSPRMRGTLIFVCLGELPDRFIPAYAGNASRADVVEAFKAVHPRVCGERSLKNYVVPQIRGSSPRMRGTPQYRALGKRFQRFIPAYAGNASSPPSRISPRAVHPRVCGERAFQVRCALACSGSSPRMRGTLGQLPEPQASVRFIPAYAGNARTRTRLRRAASVHPRVCGERNGMRIPIRS